MSKPSTVFRWADVGGAIVTPDSGKLDIGFIGGEEPEAEHMNYCLNLLGQWIAYINSGAWDGNTTFNNNVTVLGQLIPTGGIHGTAAFDAAVTIATTLGVTGATSLSTLSTSGLATLASAAITGGTTATGLITANGGLTTSSGITYTGSADEHHPDREFSIDCSGFAVDVQGSGFGSQGTLARRAFAGTTTMVLFDFFVGAGNGSGATALVAPLPRIRIGDRITHIEVVLARTGSPDGSETLSLYANAPSVTADNPVFTSGTITRPGANSVAAFDVTGINYTHVTNTGLRLAITTSSTATGGSMALRYVRVFFQRP